MNEYIDILEVSSIKSYKNCILGLYTVQYIELVIQKKKKKKKLKIKLLSLRFMLHLNFTEKRSMLCLFPKISLLASLFHNILDVS